MDNWANFVLSASNIENKFIRGTSKPSLFFTDFSTDFAASNFRKDGASKVTRFFLTISKKIDYLECGHKILFISCRYVLCSSEFVSRNLLTNIDRVRQSALDRCIVMTSLDMIISHLPFKVGLF